MTSSARIARSLSSISRIAPLLLVGALASVRVDAQQSVFVRDRGPGPIGRRLAEALAAPHLLIPPASTPALLPRDSTYAQTVIVLQRSVIVEAHVHGDVIVVGGDAFLHPGAIVDGRVMAIGGGVYESRLAITRLGVESYRDFTFVVGSGAAGYVLDYRPLRVQQPARFALPGVYGVRIPKYDRIDGLSLSFGPFISIDTGRYEIDPTITYRSHLGAFDPAVNATLSFARRTAVDIYVGRNTFTNDSWIWSDLVNSASALAVGIDTRNYYRADRGEAVVHQLFEMTTGTFQPYLGARLERGWSVARAIGATSYPWSVFDRDAGDRMRRPNPAVLNASVKSLLLGGYFTWEAQRLQASINLANEGAALDVGSLRFVQSTLHAQIRFPTFGAQQFYASTHVLYTFGDTAPPQRWTYLGGSGTLPTLSLLSLGGDRLFYLESNYYVPFVQWDLPIVGPPSLTLRHLIGSAGVGKLPSFHQNLGLRLSLSFARADFVVDPATRETEFSFGLSLAR